MTKAKRRTRTRPTYDVDYEAFVKLWTLAESAEQVAAQLSLPRGVVYRVSRQLRAQGVALKQMGRGVVDVRRLNEIIDEAEKS